MSRNLQQDEWPKPSRQVLGGLAPKWGQEALRSLITCHQCSNAINELDPLVMGRRASFISKTDRTFVPLLSSIALFLNCLGLWVSTFSFFTFLGEFVTGQAIIEKLLFVMMIMDISLITGLRVGLQHEIFILLNFNFTFTFN